MAKGISRGELVATAAAIFAVVLGAQAIGAGSGGDPAGRATGAAQIKKLKAQVRQLKQRVSSIENQGAKPKGDAGGDLDGSYPNPVIAPDAVTSSRIFNGTVAAEDLASQEAVQTPTMENCVASTPWTSDVAFARPAGFWKDAFGVVHLEGSVGCTGNATEGVTIFVLPAGYRPPDQSGTGVIRFLALGSGVTPVQLAILDCCGNLVYDGPDGSNDDYISLDGLTFRAGG
jgi:hypothetical protein